MFPETHHAQLSLLTLYNDICLGEHIQADDSGVNATKASEIQECVAECYDLHLYNEGLKKFQPRRALMQELLWKKQLWTLTPELRSSKLPPSLQNQQCPNNISV